MNDGLQGRLNGLGVRIALPEPTSTDAAYNQRAWAPYFHALTSSGAVGVPIPLDAPPATIAKLVGSCSGVLLPGSPADVNPQKYGAAPIPECAAPDPAREAVDELLLQDAFNMHKPLFGICYGLQALNVWRGGTLIQHVPLVTSIDHDPGSGYFERAPCAPRAGGRSWRRSSAMMTIWFRLPSAPRPWSIPAITRRSRLLATAWW